ncbi:MAG: discoidin domain-containing protein, partial [Lachnospiraceae bacterium]|nr:discoidin domain-containing protein [Lachnospiraceae bacterium]
MIKRKLLKRDICSCKKTLSVLVLIILLVFVLQMGKDGLPADFVEQDSWHLIYAKVISEGIEVETAGENLVLHSGVKVRADSRENKEFSADMVRDGIKDNTNQRWSSANDWENNEHWLEISFPHEETVGLVRIYWERTNACSYMLEYSSDRKNWITAVEFNERPAEVMQDIYLDKPVSAKYLRLHVTDVVKEEADLSLYYQNVSVLEMEVYEGIKDKFLIEKPDIPANNRRQLVEKEVPEDEPYREYTHAVLYPEVPEGYSLKFIGANYDMLIESDGKIANTIADTKVEIGFALEKDRVSFELPGMEVEIPSALGVDFDSGSLELSEGYTAMEWQAQG